MRHAAFLLALLVASPALADDARTFQGELDGKPVILELTDGTSGPVVGRLAYLEVGGDIPLLPVSSEGNVWVLNEEAPCDETTCKTDDAGNAIDPPLAAEWRLTYDPDTYIATGTRTSLGGKAKVIDVELYAIAWRTMGADELITPYGLHDRSAVMGYDETVPLDWSVSPYEMSLLGVPFDLAEPERLGGATIQYVTDPRTKFAFPRITAFDGEEGFAMAETANAILQNEHGRMNLSAFDCLAFQYASYGRNEYMAWAGGTLGDYDNETVRMTFASPKLISWVQSGSLWCSGAHPYNHIDSYTFDLETGTQLDLAKVFSAWVPREWGAAIDDIATPEVIAADPEMISWGPRADLIAYVREKVPADFFDAELKEFCFTDEAIAENLNIRFEIDAQVTFTFSGFPHVASVCNGDLVTVPWAELTAFVTPEAAAYFPGT